MKKNLQQKKFLVTLLALCLSLGAKAQEGEIFTDIYNSVRGNYPSSELKYDDSDVGTVNKKIQFGAPGYGDWVFPGQLSDVTTDHFSYQDEGMDGIVWHLNYVCAGVTQYNVQGQAGNHPFIIVGDKDRSEAQYVEFSTEITNADAFVDGISIEFSNDYKLEQEFVVELYYNDVLVKQLTETLKPFQDSYHRNEHTFAFDVQQYGPGSYRIKISNMKCIRVYNISYVGTTKPFVELLVTEYKYASMYYSQYNLIVPTAAAEGFVYNTQKKELETVENPESASPFPATYVYSDGVLHETTTYSPGEIIPKGTAVVVSGTPGCVYRFYVAAESGNPKPHNGSDLKGTDEAETTTGGKYYYALSLNPKNELNSVGFYWMKWSYIEDKDSGKRILVGGEPFINGAHKAYLALDEQPAGHEIKNHFLFNEISSGIENVEQEEGVKTIYNLAGQRLTKMQKGINIVNGKKVLVK